MIEYIIPKKLIGWNMNFGFSLFRVFKCTFLKNNWKKIKDSLRYQIFQEHMNSIKAGIILPKQLQIQIFKFYSKDWLFLKISTELQIQNLQFHDLMLLRKFDVCFDPPNLCRFLSEYFYLREAFLSKEKFFFDKSRVLVYTF